MKLEGNFSKNIKLIANKIFSKIYFTVNRNLLFLVIYLFGAFIFSGWLASEVFEGEAGFFDDSIRQSVHQISSPVLTQLMILFSFFGSFLFLGSFGLVILLIFFRQHRNHSLKLFLIVMAGELILNFILKDFFQRQRPTVFFDYQLPTSYSFPSGHAFGSFCFYGILVWLITSQIHNLYLKITIWILTSFLIFLIGLSRVYLGVHFPSDVIAGYVAAFLWILSVLTADYYFNNKQSNEEKLAIYQKLKS